MTEAENIFLRAYDILVLLLNRNNRPAAQNFALEVGAVADRYAAANKIQLAPHFTTARPAMSPSRAADQERRQEAAGGTPPRMQAATAAQPGLDTLQ